MKVGRHEYGQFTGVHRRARSISSIRRGTTADSFSSKIYDRPTRTGVPQESGCQSEPTRSKAKGQAFRFPRPCRLDFGGRLQLAGQFGIRQTLPDDLTNSDIEVFAVRQFPIIEAERLFIEIPEQVGTVQR